jgi:hypothetical protein
MRRIGFVVLATMLVLGTVGAVSWSMASGKSSAAGGPETLRLVIPASGFVVTQSSDLNIVHGRLDSTHGERVGHIRGSCVIIQPETGAYNPALKPSFRLGVAAGTGMYKKARGQARLDFGTSGDISATIRLFR